MIASGARGVRTGDFSMTWDQPPGVPYLDGVAIRTYDVVSKALGGAGVRFPSEEGTIVLPPELAAQLPPSIHATGPVPKWGLYDRYDYAREFFFKSGNDPESLAFAARLTTILLASLLGLAVAVFAWRTAGPAAAVIAVSLFVFLPDELAQGGIAYNDVALALCFFIASRAIDACIRRPTPRSAVIAGAATGLALGVKFSALTLGPIAILLCAAEWVSRRRDAAWRNKMAAATLIALGIGVVVLFVIYGGDLTLTQFREGVREQIRHSSSGHGVPAYLFGHTSDDRLWYFFPVALVLKTPIAFHVLAIIAALGYVASRKNGASWLTSPLRFLVVGTVVYLAVLMRSNLDIGVRYALVVASAASPLVRYPWFLSYITEWVPPQASRPRWSIRTWTGDRDCWRFATSCATSTSTPSTSGTSDRRCRKDTTFAIRRCRAGARSRCSRPCRRNQSGR